MVKRNHEPHVCPRCGGAGSWHGPPEMGKLKALLFRLWHRSPPFVTHGCGRTLSVKEWVREESKGVIILDNNPLSIACYLEEFGNIFEEKKEG